LPPAAVAAAPPRLVRAIKAAFEAAVRGGNMDDEQEFAAPAVARSFRHSRRTGHD
jgi:hypothetical protein